TVARRRAAAGVVSAGVPSYSALTGTLRVEQQRCKGVARVRVPNRKCCVAAGPRARWLLWVTSTQAGSHVGTAEVPQRADRIAAAPQKEEVCQIQSAPVTPARSRW